MYDEENSEPEAGRYLARVFESFKLKRTKRGLAQLSGKVEILQGDPQDSFLKDNPEELFRYEGTTMYWNGYLSLNALKFTFSALRAMGWQGYDITDTSSVLPRNGGRTFLIEVDTSEYTGKMQVKNVYPYGEDVLKEFDFRAQIPFAEAEKIATQLKPLAQLFSIVDGASRILPPAKTQQVDFAPDEMPF